MSTPLAHSPAAIVRGLLIDQDLATAAGAWPAYTGNEPESPDNVLTVYDTAGTSDGRSMIDGEEYLHRGIQVRVRATDYPTGWAKAEAIRQGLAEGVRQAVVTVGGTAYLVACLARVGNVLALGKETRTSQRVIFTLNALLSVRAL